MPVAASRAPLADLPARSAETALPENLHSTPARLLRPLPPALWALWALTLGLLGGVLLWDAGGLDLPLARWAGSAQGFAWRSVPALVLWLHEVPRALSMGLLVLLGIGAVWPYGFLRRLARRERVQLVLSILAAIAVSTLVKRLSNTSCPWDLAEFGGVARHVSHWHWGVLDGGPGHCFPAGHASAAFGFVAGWFVLRRAAPGMATGWLRAALAGGLVLGLAQQLRGAHYLSHTLWSAWICWTVGLVVECGVAAAAALRHRRQMAKVPAEVQARKTPS
ncbi:MAG: phosphatase PAP2 family protein [Giesbergeria sp.]|nr:phosphatase PAP2 family protein [Giesbergeria sp.]